MQQVVPGQANKVTLDMVAKADGDPITSGTVTFYLRARNGANAGKWFRASDSTWQSAESSAGTATHIGTRATWELSIVAAAWIGGVTYDLYGDESGHLQLDYTEQVVTWAPPNTGTGEVEWFYELTDSITTNPIAGAEVWVTTDSDGDNIVAHDITDEFGKVYFFLAAGTYYVWCAKAGYTFNNPDTEVVS